VNRMIVHKTTYLSGVDFKGLFWNLQRKPLW